MKMPNRFEDSDIDLHEDIADAGRCGTGYPNLRHVRLLEAAVRERSLTRAAETVHISQPAASQALARLNAQFGGPLLERQGNGVVPTPRGEVVVARAARALGYIREAAQRIARRCRSEGSSTPDLLETHATISHLRAASLVAHTGSFSAAARALGQSEPSVHRAAREIEGILGVTLFDEAYRRLQTTPAGRTLATAASLVLKELDNAFEEVREFEGDYAGRIVIGTLPLVRSRIVPQAVVEIARRHPRARIRILDGSYEALAQGVVVGSIDMIVGALRQELEHEDLTQKRLFDDSLSIVARAGHPLAGTTTLTDADLVRYPWVLPRRATPSRAVFEVLASRFPREAPQAGFVETGSLVALRGILTQSDFLTIVSPRQIWYELRAGQLCVLPIDLGDTRRPIGLTLRADWRPTALQADFLAALDHAVGDLSPGAGGN